MEEKDTIVTLIDEDNGQPVDFDLLLTFSYEGRRYAALQPLDEVEGIAEDEIVLLEIVKDSSKRPGKTVFIPGIPLVINRLKGYATQIIIHSVSQKQNLNLAEIHLIQLCNHIIKVIRRRDLDICLFLYAEISRNNRNRSSYLKRFYLWTDVCRRHSHW